MSIPVGEMDVLTASGEQVTIALLSTALLRRGISPNLFWRGSNCIPHRRRPRRARIEHIDTQKLQIELANGVVPVVAGFQGVNEHGEITTLGRGGSDTSAVALAAAPEADECELVQM